MMEQQQAQPVGFDRGLEPEKILGAMDWNGQIVYLVQWKGTDDKDLIASEEIKERCPQLAIAYFEQRLNWTPDYEAESSDSEAEEPKLVIINNNADN